MNREIKFRAWDGEKIIYQEQDGFFKSVKHPKYPHFQTMQLYNTMQVCEIMQYTGLKDRTGKDVYEGDILLTPAGTTKVIFDNGCFYVPTGNSKYRLGGWVTDSIEIIGNIFENPELLKQ